MSDILKTPWPKEVVDKLNEYQKSGKFHPYTCGHCRDKYGTRFIRNEKGELVKEPADFKSWEGDNWKQVVLMERNLIATENGWVCETCDNVQDWCHSMTISLL